MKRERPGVPKTDKSQKANNQIQSVIINATKQRNLGEIEMFKSKAENHSYSKITANGSTFIHVQILLVIQTSWIRYASTQIIWTKVGAAIGLTS